MEDGLPAWLVFRRLTETSANPDNSRWPAVESHSSYTTGREPPALRGGAPSRHHPQGLYRLPKKTNSQTF
jgi:hypothetical protein